MADLSKIQADVAAQTSLIVSVVALITSLVQAIRDLKSQVSQDPATQQAIDQLATQIEANTTELTTAVQSNT